MAKYLETFWAEKMAGAIKRAGASDQEIQNMHEAFFFGAMAMFQRMKESAEAGDGTSDLILDDLVAELTNFQSSVIAELDARKARGG